MLCFPLRIGASTALAEKLTPETLLKLIQDHRATIVFTAPTFYRQMATLAPQFDLSSLKKSVSAGEALPDATRQAWKAATGIEMTDGLGGTEMMHIFISGAGADVRPGAVGRVVPGYEARIVDEASAAGCHRARSASWPCAGHGLPLPGRPAPDPLRARRLEPARRHLHGRRRRLLLLSGRARTT